MKVKISKQPQGDLATKYPFALPNETVEIADHSDAQALIDGGFGTAADGDNTASASAAQQRDVANQDKSK